MDQSLFLNNAPPFLDSRLLGKSCIFTNTGTERTEDYMNQKAGKGKQYQREGLQRLGTAQEAPILLLIYS